MPKSRAPIAALILLLAGFARAQEPPTPTPAAPEPLVVTRADLAAAYMRFDKAIMANPPAPDREAEVSKKFDEATLLFFSGKNAPSIAMMNELTAGLDPSQPRTPALDLARSLKLIQQERTWMFVDWAFALYPRLASIYPVTLPGEGEAEFTLRARAEDGTAPPLMEKAFKVKAGGEINVDQTVTIFADSLPIGAYDVEVGWSGGEAVKVGKYFVVPRKLAEIRAENEGKLAKIEAGSPALKQSLAACKARNGLLNEKPSDTNSAQFLANPNQLIKELDAEIAALADGENPYRRRTGDYWRVLATSKKEIPMRLYAPESAKENDPIPVVIALHGAGGDENMFMDAYGAGLIKKLADKNRFLVASPATQAFSGDAEAMGTLLDTLSSLYPIDEARVYVIGHSMGGGATTGIAKKYADMLAGACCLAGAGNFTGGAGLPPTLVIAADIDGVVPYDRVKQAADKGIEAGLPIEFRTVKNQGHLMMVNKVLPDAIAWLLEHHR